MQTLFLKIVKTFIYLAVQTEFSTTDRNKTQPESTY